MNETPMKTFVETIFKEIHEWVAPAFKAIEARIEHAEKAALANKSEMAAKVDRQAQQISSLTKQIAALERKQH